MIFSRRSRSGRHAKPEDSRGTTLTAAEKRRAQRAALLEELELTDLAGAPRQAATTSVGTPAAAFIPDGPYDIEEDAVPPANRVDLGSLLVPTIDGVEIRLQTADNGVVQQVLLVEGTSALQLAVLAAPRSDGLWDEVRADIRKSLFDDGVGAEEIEGPWGTELRARLRTPEGFVDLRFAGVDGPRWMVQGVYQGPAAAGPLEAIVLQQCLSGLVVRRGEEARPAREPLPMRLPEEMAAQQAAEAQAAAQSFVEAAPMGDPLVPGPVPPTPEPTRYSTAPEPARYSTAEPSGYALTQEQDRYSAPQGPDLTSPEVPRRKPSPRPRRD